MKEWGESNEVIYVSLACTRSPDAVLYRRLAVPLYKYFQLSLWSAQHAGLSVPPPCCISSFHVDLPQAEPTRLLFSLAHPCSHLQQQSTIILSIESAQICIGGPLHVLAGYARCGSAGEAAFGNSVMVDQTKAELGSRSRQDVHHLTQSLPISML